MSQIQFIGTTPENLIREIKSSLVSELEEKLSKKFQPKEPEEYLTRTEVCELLKIDLSTLWRWMKSNKFPFYGIGNRVYCKRSEVEDFLNKNRLN